MSYLEKVRLNIKVLYLYLKFILDLNRFWIKIIFYIFDKALKTYPLKGFWWMSAKFIQYIRNRKSKFTSIDDDGV
jgi:hypothetical protein